MVTLLWDRRCDGCKLFGIDTCELCKHSGDTRVTGKTDGLLGQSMATEQKVQHVDERDVGLDLNPLVKTVVRQIHCESSWYSFYVAGYPRLAERIVDRVVNFVRSAVSACIGVEWELRCPGRPWNVKRLGATGHDRE